MEIPIMGGSPSLMDPAAIRINNLAKNKSACARADASAGAGSGEAAGDAAIDDASGEWVR
jgi:hypothetical protein